MLRNKSSRKEEGSRSWHFVIMAFYLSEEPVVRSCFPEGAWTPACWWAVVDEILFVLSLWEQHLLSLLNCHCLSPWAFLPSFYFLPIPCRRGIGKVLDGCVAAGLGQLQPSKRTQVTTFCWIAVAQAAASALHTGLCSDWLITRYICRNSLRDNVKVGYEAWACIIKIYTIIEFFQNKTHLEQWNRRMELI